MVEAPEPVLAFLCHLSKLHSIPVGDASVNNLDNVPPEFARYFSNTHQVKQSTVASTVHQIILNLLLLFTVIWNH